MMNIIGNSFYTSIVSGSESMGNPQAIAEEVLNALPAKDISFSVIHQYSGLRVVSGYIYGGKQYGVLSIKEFGGSEITFFISGGVFQQRIDNFGCNSLAELAGGVAGMFNKSYAQDMNDAVGHNESGMYSNSTLNLPSGLTGFGVYTVFRAKYEANDSLFLVQMLFPENSTSNEVYIRKCWNNTWTSWRRIATP